MKILVTGGSGTIGGYVLRELLQHGHEVSNYGRTPPRVAGIPHISGEILNLDQIQAALSGRDAVIHLAAVPGPRRETLHRLVEINTIGTLQVLEACRLSGVPRLVFASSAAALGFSFPKRKLEPRYFPVDEEHPSEPQDEYGLSKLLAETSCKSYSDAYGMQTLCLRINNNWYLDRQGASLAVQSGWAKGMAVEELWTKRYLKTILDAEGEWPVPGPPSPRTNLWVVTDARDASQAFRLAAENTQLQHEVFLISGADSCSFTESSALAARHYPQVPFKTPVSGMASLVSWEKAGRLLGYRPQFSWRQGEFREWLDQQMLERQPESESLSNAERAR